MQDLQHADCTVTPQPQPTPHGGQDQLNKHHYDLPEYDEKPSLTELIEDSTPPPNIPLTGSPPTVLTTLEYCSLPPLSLSCKLQGYLESTNILLVACHQHPRESSEQHCQVQPQEVYSEQHCQIQFQEAYSVQHCQVQEVGSK